LLLTSVFLFVVYTAKEIILTSGAFNTPQLLLLSGIGPQTMLEAAGIAPHVDLPGVGRNLGDHPRVHLIAVLNNSSSSLEEIPPDHFDTAMVNWCFLPSILESSEFQALAPGIRKFIASPHNPTCEIYLVQSYPSPFVPSLLETHGRHLHRPSWRIRKTQPSDS
jgi:GMC oxidoreductase